MVFKSSEPDIDLPTNITTWTWLFNSPASPLSTHGTSPLAGYTNALTNESISYAEVKTHATHLSTALVKNYGLKKGDIVALFSSNNIWYPVAMFAVNRVAGIISGASPAYNVEEMTYALKTGKAKYIFTVPGSMNIAAAAANNAGISKENVFLLEGEMEGFKTMKELLEIGKGYDEEGQVEEYLLKAGEKNTDLCGFLSFSSGTTGLPKAVMISHANVIAQCLQMLPLTPEDHRKILAVLPVFHITGLVNILHYPVRLNATVYMLSTFTLPTMLRTIERYSIAEPLLVPPLLILLVRSPIVSNYDLRCIKRFTSGAAPLSPSILKEMQQKFPWTGFKQGYGMTESACCITATPMSHYDYKYSHTVGKVCPSTTIKIIREDGSECGINEPGELLAKGPQVTMGYLNNPKATSETFDSEGYLHTGDQAMIDADGVVTITDRIKELIKVKGIGIAPAELEDLLLGHPSVADAAVLSIPDEYAGERPKAFVVPKSLSEAASRQSNDVETEEHRLTNLGKDLLAYTASRKTRPKHIKEIEFVTAIPKSASGKILRRVLKDGKGVDGKPRERGVVVREEERVRSRL